MAASRRHRGPHPTDAQLFGPAALPALRSGVEDLSWLRSRGYADPSAIKLVGDRYQLRGRQRVAVGRCACSDSAKELRASKCRGVQAVAGHALVLDGLNVITTIEVALAGGVLLLGRDGCLRDMASFHGNYRLVKETERAVTVLLEALDSLRLAQATVYIDRPVSNSGRLAEIIRREAATLELPLEAVTAQRVDETLANSAAVVATADSAILDRCGGWLNLARIVIERISSDLHPLWLLDFS